jgi:hypothetical protein
MTLQLVDSRPGFTEKQAVSSVRVRHGIDTPFVLTSVPAALGREDRTRLSLAAALLPALREY